MGGKRRQKVRLHNRSCISLSLSFTFSISGSLFSKQDHEIHSIEGGRGGGRVGVNSWWPGALQPQKVQIKPEAGAEACRTCRQQLPKVRGLVGIEGRTPSKLPRCTRRRGEDVTCHSSEEWRTGVGVEENRVGDRNTGSELPCHLFWGSDCHPDV